VGCGGDGCANNVMDMVEHMEILIALATMWIVVALTIGLGYLLQECPQIDACHGSISFLG
jgi:hypothetical protein